MKPTNLFSQRCILILFLSTFMITTAYTQKSGESILNYDVIYMKDGRVLKGEILIFQESDGDLTFTDLKGRKYSITRKEYKYFEENVRYQLRNNDTIAIRPRKESEFEVTIGFTPYSVILAEGEFEGSKETAVDNTLMTLCINVGVGKYFTRQHYLGVNLDYAILPNHYFGNSIKGKLSNYFAAGARYKFQYDAYKRNTAWFLAAKGKFNAIKGDLSYQYPNPWGSGTTSTYLTEKHTTISMGLGQGVAFILNNKKSINLELSVSRHFTLSSKLLDEPDATITLLPFTDRRFSEITLSLMYNL